MKSSICLGSAQFGMEYGITNKTGKIKQKDVKNILDIASKNSVKFIDTAQIYGDSEKVIGMSLPKNHDYQIISKLKKLPDHLKPKEIYKYLNDRLEESLINLKIERLDSLLVHKSSDLFGNNADLLINWANDKSKEGKIRRFGVSVYDSSEIKRLPLNKIQIVQLPLSIFDQRLIINGTLDFLNQKKISIHARSIFLQGLILADTMNLPSFLSKRFINNHRRFSEYCISQKYKKLELAIAFIKSLDFLESFLIGIENEDQLKEILKIWRDNKINQYETLYSIWNFKNIDDIDPRKWPN